MRSRKVNSIFAFEILDYPLNQIRFPNSEFWFKDGNDTVWLKGPGSLHLKQGTVVPIRFIPGKEDMALPDTFRGIWLDTIIYGGIPFLILIVIFLQPGIIPYRSKIRLTGRQPFVQILT